MVYLKRGMNKSYYSVAYKRYRNALLRDNLGTILTAGIALGVGGLVLRRVLKRRRAERKAAA